MKIKMVLVGLATLALSTGAISKELKMPLPDFCAAVAEAHDKKKGSLDGSYVVKVKVEYIDKEGKPFASGTCNGDTGNFTVCDYTVRKSSPYRCQNFDKRTAGIATKTFIIGQFRYWTREEY